MDIFTNSPDFAAPWCAYLVFCEVSFAMGSRIRHPWKLLTQRTDVIQSTFRASMTTYDCQIESVFREPEMAIRVMKFSLAAVTVALSLVAFSAVVIG
jgi:hypothetical protein